MPSIYAHTHIYEFVRNGNIHPLWNEYTKQEAHRIIDRMAVVYVKQGIYRVSDIPLIHRICELILRPDGYISEMPADWPAYCMDRNDDPFLWVATTGRAEFIITDDKHLLRLRRFRAIPIGTPARFFTWAKRYRPMA